MPDYVDSSNYTWRLDTAVAVVDDLFLRSEARLKIAEDDLYLYNFKDPKNLHKIPKIK